MESLVKEKSGIMKTRIGWMDTAKGMGILLVIVGHCFNINGRPFQLIFTFHMPLFFWLSGYLFQEKLTWKELLRKKAISLLLPFCMFYLLGLIVTLLVPEWRMELTWQGIWNDIWLGNPNAVHNSSIWFLICLFIVQMLFYIILKLPCLLQIVVLVVLYFTGIVYSRIRMSFLGMERLPLNIDVAFVAIVFFAAGYFMKKSGLVERLLYGTYQSAICSILGTIVTYMVLKINGYVNLHGLNFGNPILYLLGGFSGTIAVLGGAVFLEEMDGNIWLEAKNILRWYGRHSLMILGLQSLCIRLYMVAKERYQGIQLVLYHFLHKDTYVCAVLVSFFVCPFLCILWDQTIRFIRYHIEKGS